MDVFFKKSLRFFCFILVFQLLITSFYVKSIETCESIFVASSGVATISTSDAELLNFITGGLLGLNAKLSVADTEYSSLLTAGIDLESYLDTLAIDLSVANKSDAVAANITLTQAIDAAITVLQSQGGNTVAIATLEDIKLVVPTNTFSLLDVIDLNVEDNAVLSTTVNVLDFHMLIIQAFNHQNAISAENISLNLSTLGLNGTFGPLSISLSDVSAALIAVEGPKLISGPVGTAFTTSSIRLRILADLIDVAAAPLSLGAASVEVTLTDFEFYADVARANGTVDQLSYLTQTLRLNVTPGVASLYLGQISDVDFNDRSLTSDIDYATEVAPVVIGSIDINLSLGGSETIALEARANANANGALESLNFVSPFPESQTTTAGVGVVNTLLSTLFSNTVLTTTPSPALVNTTLLLNLIRSLVVDDILSPVISDIVTNVADPTADALGISIGNATEKVFAINGGSCIPTVDNLNTADPTPTLSGLAYRSLVDSELLTIELNNITYHENVDFAVTNNQWSLNVPPEDTMTDGVYNVIATVTNGVSSISDQTNAELTVDSSQPSVQIQNVPANTNIAFTATFSFSEDVSEFAVGDIIVGNGSATSFTTVNTSTYTALITPVADGTVPLDINANVAQDSAGNFNTAATQVTSQYDASRPSVVIQNVPATSNAPFTVTFTFSEAVIGFTSGDISVGNGGASSFTTVDTSTYTALITPIADGSVTLDVSANVAQDSVGNLNTAATQVSSNYDASRPSVLIQNVPVTSNAPFTVTFTFSEAVIGFVVGDISVGNGSASSFSTVNTSTYTALITPIADGAVTLDVNANIAQDSVGNLNTAATQASSTYDASRPSITIQNVPATSNAPFTVTFTFSEAVIGFTSGDIIVGNGGASSFTTVDTSTYTALITPIADGSVTLDINANVAQDSVGNLNTAATQASSTYDASRPSVLIQNVPATSNAPFTVTFTFSEAVSGFTSGDIIVGNGSASSFTTVDTSTYTALITPIADGAVTLDVNANIAQDSVGNLNTAATQASSTYDASRPSITIQNVPATSNAPFTVTFTFSEAVIGFTSGDIIVGNGGASSFTTVDSSTYTALITPTTDGAVTLDVNANVAQDSVGNLNTAASQVSSTYDASRPSVTIQNVPATSNAPFTVTFTFSEAVTDFVVGDISVGNGNASSFTTVDTSTYTALITPTADGAVTLDVNANVAQDSVGNLNTAATQVTSTYDASRPSVVIQNVPATSNAPFTVTFTFSEAVSGFDVGDIVVGNGSASSFTTVNTSTYTAVITPTADGSVTIDVSANVAQDSADNLNTAATQVTSQYDASRPSVLIQNVPATSNAPFTVTFSFSEAVSGFTSGDIIVGNGGASSFTTVDSSTYTALITPIADGAVTLDVNANVAQDSVGNFNTAATQVSSTYDASRPSVLIQNVPATSNAPFTVTFSFSEAVSGFTSGDIIVGNGGASSFTTVDSSTYTALITPIADGAVTLDVNANVAQDSVGNFNTAATQVSSTYDASRPSVIIQNVPATSNAPFTVTFTFSEAVIGFTSGDISVGNGGASSFTTVDTSTYTALITPIADGSVTLDINANVAQDSVGNFNTAATQVSSTYDASRPSVLIQNVPATSNAPFTVTFTFSEAVTGFVIGDISVGNGNASNFTTVNTSTYTALITPIADGSVTLDVNANVAQDSVGNLNTAATQVSSTYDASRPSVVIQNVPTTSNAPFTVTITFSEAVIGFTSGDISVGNGGASSFTTVDSSTYTALITPTTDGAVTLDVNANVAQDSVGNLNTAATQVSSTYDASRPSVVIQNVPATSNAPFTVTFTFSEAVTDFVVGDISVGNGNASGFTTVDTSTYTALITPTADGVVTLDVNANIAQDSVGNLNTAATQVSSTYDASRPSVTIQNVPATSNAPFTVTFTFSEAVIGFTSGDISVGNGGASSFTTVDTSTYTALITPLADGSVTLDVSANVAQDSVGNFNTAATQVSSNYDASRPSVLIQNVPATSNAPFNVTFTFSEAVTDFVVGDISVGNGNASGFTTVDTSTYTALITPTADGVVTLDVNANIAQDSVGNLNTAATQVSSTYDASRPSVTIQNVPATSNAPFTVTFTFSEAVTGFTSGDIIVGNGGASSFTTLNTSNYTALITPAADGAVTLDVNDNVAQDSVGNLNTAAAQVSSTYDASRPSILIQNVPVNSNSSFTATFAFSEVVTGFIVTDITLTNATASSFTAVNGSTYTALITPLVTGAVTLDVNANVAQDSVGNLNTAATQVSSSYDASRPSVTIQNVPSSGNSSFTATFVFSADVTGFVLGDITLTNAAASSFTTINGSTYTTLITPIAEGVVTLDVNANVAQDSIGNLNTAATQVTSLYDASRPSVVIQNVPGSSNNSFTATFAFSENVLNFIVSDISVTNATVSNFIAVNGSNFNALITPIADGAVTVNINANVAQDTVGNLNTAATQVTSQYDASRPSVVIQNVPTSSNNAFTTTLAFSEAVTGFVVGDITLTNAAASGFTTVNSSTYTALITPITDGAVTVNINANVAQDSVGNLNTAAAQVLSQYDISRPSVVIQNVPANSNNAFTATFSFNEAVINFILSDISVSNAVISNFTAVSSSSYTALVTPTSDGVVTLNVNANVAQDTTGNLNTAAAQITSQYDGTRPSIIIENVPTNSSSAFTASFVFSENVINFIQSDITATNANISNFTAVNASNYTALITPVANGVVTLNVNANIAQDSIGNLNTAATQVTSQYDVSRASVVIQNVPINSASPFTATFVFSKAVTGFLLSDIGITNADISNFTVVDGSTYTALITPLVDGPVTLDVSEGVAQDSNDNLNTAATPVTSLYDASRPAITIENVPLNSQSAFTATFVFSEPVINFILSDISLSNATISNFTVVDDRNYTALITPIAEGLVTLDVNANVAQDSIGNLNTAAVQVTSQFDASRPAVVIQNAPAVTRNAFTATIVFSEPVQDFVVDDISATNATINNFVVIDASNYTALITPISEGDVTLNVNENVAQDSNANFNTAAAEVTSQYDITAPEITILNGSTINIVNQSNYNIEGTCDDENVVVVIVNTSSPNSVNCDEGLWVLNKDMSAIADGAAVVTVNANQTDSAGNIGNAEPVDIDKDTEKPVISINRVIYSQNDALIFSGTSDTEDGSAISIIESTDNNLCEAPVNNKAWNCESGIVLSEGTYDLRAEAQDEAENLSIIYFSQTVNFDEDNDGIKNSVEGYGDSDNDGIPDAQDTDSDNDGIPDSEEGVGDDDRDNIPNYLDTNLDEDADGVPDVIEGNTDVDNDGIINAFDIDSDNDGIVDGYEAQISGNDIDQDGIDDIFDADIGGDDPDGDGITYQIIDTDNDGIADFLDVDSDGDRIPDALEAFVGFQDLDNDGIWDRYDQSYTLGSDIDNDGIDDLYDADQTNGLDVDNDGINDLLIILNDHNKNFRPDHLDIDSDSDGIHDSIEANITGFDHDNDGIDDAFDSDLSNELDVNNDGIIDTFVFIDTDADGIIDMNDLDSDNDGDTDTSEANVQDDDKDGIADIGSPVITDVIDTDADSILDYVDLDSDNDGVFDIQNNANSAFDLNNDGRVDITEDIDGDGIDDSIDGNTQVLGHGSNADSDGDSVLDVIDKDDDNDGIADVTERRFENTVNDLESIDGSQITNVRRMSSIDTRRAMDSDNDGIINEKDRDSDNDGISDLIENGRPNLSGFDHDQDGIDDVFDADFTGGVDNDQDGVDDIFIVKDTDQDSAPDYLDLDSDNDKISDNIEQLTVPPSGVDTNGNGIDDAFDPVFNSNQDDNLDGIDDTLVVLSNPDGDNILNFQDTDSDGDGIEDINEQARDFDGDGTPNYLDLDSDNDKISDAIEGLNDFDLDGASNFLDLDSDGDNISDEYEGNIDFDADGSPDFLDLDSDNDSISDARETINDFDGDGASNYKDLDSDNDGISDEIEGDTDFDSDGASNFLDLDSDDDGISDAVEGESDFDVDGDPNFLDLDSDGDGLSDIEEGEIDSDNDGTPNFLDLDSDNDGIADKDENGDFNSDGINDATQDQRKVQSTLKGSGNVGGFIILMLLLLAIKRNTRVCLTIQCNKCR